MSRAPAGRLPEAMPPASRPDLERLFHAEYGRVVAVARRVLGSDREAEDVAQDVFIAFNRSAVTTADARGWLLTAAAHTALNVIRSNSRRARREVASATPDQVPDVADEVIRRDRQVQVREVLSRLPQNQSMVLLLRHSGMSYGEVGAALGMPASSVGTTLRRAEAAVRKELENDESRR